MYLLAGEITAQATAIYLHVVQQGRSSTCYCYPQPQYRVDIDTIDIRSQLARNHTLAPIRPEGWLRVAFLLK
jgi:hypothetical protein